MAGGLDQIAPAGAGAAITPSDTVDLGYIARGLYVGVAGDVTMDIYHPLTKKRTPTLFKNCGAGSTIPWSTERVYATGTTATNLVSAV